MRKPNYLQIRFNTGRVIEEFMIPYADFEKSFNEIGQICIAATKCKHFSAETKEFFRLLLLNLTSVDNRNYELLNFFNNG